MKPVVPLILIFILAGVGARITDRQCRPPLFKVIVVDRFVNSNGTTQSAAFIQSFCDGMRDELLKTDLAGQVVEEGLTVNAPDAARSLIIEGRFTSYARGGFLSPGRVGVEIDIYRASDHGLVKTLTPPIAYRPTPLTTDKSLGEWAGGLGSRFIQQSLNGVNLSAIPAAPTIASK